MAILFTDVVGSTELAATRPPEEVVDLLNSFFGLVVEVVDEHGGWVNKFEGDAALAVFGAPVPLPDPASAALAAARELAERLPRASGSRRRPASLPVRWSPATSATSGASSTR